MDTTTMLVLDADETVRDTAAAFIAANAESPEVLEAVRAILSGAALEVHGGGGAGAEWTLSLDVAALRAEVARLRREVEDAQAVIRDALGAYRAGQRTRGDTILRDAAARAALTGKGGAA